MEPRTVAQVRHYNYNQAFNYWACWKKSCIYTLYIISNLDGGYAESVMKLEVSRMQSKTYFSV